MTSDGSSSISGANITLTGPSGQTFFAHTNPFGYFQLADVPAGETYIVQVRRKGLVFDPFPINVQDNISDIVIIPRAAPRIPWCDPIKQVRGLISLTNIG